MSTDDADAGPRDDAEQDDATMPEDTLTERQLLRLATIAVDFDGFVERLPDDKGEVYQQRQQEVAETRRRAQASEGLLRTRIK